MKALQKWFSIITIELAFLCCSARADVFDIKAGAGPGLQAAFSDQHTPGPGLSIFSELGLSESLSVSLSTAFGIHEKDPEGSELLSFFEVGALYAIDVVEVVPFAGVKVGWMASGLGIGVIIGLDYLWTESFFAGFAVEAYEMFEGFSGLPEHASFFIRFGYRWVY